MPFKNKEDKLAYQRAWYVNNKKLYADKNKRLRDKKKVFLQKLKSVPCMDCRNSYPYFVMDFDHREGEEKLGTLAAATSSNLWSWEKLKAEVEKCDVVCSNCHRIRTAKRGGWYDSEWDVGIPARL